MRLRLTFITGISLLLIAAHLILVWTGSAPVASLRYLLFIVGILGWAIGNKLIEVEDRLDDIDKALARPAGSLPANN